MSDSVQPHKWQPTRLPRPWDSPGKNTGVGCHFLLQCMTGEMLGSDCRLARVRHRELTASHPEITANTEQGVPVSTRGVWGTQASSHPSCHLVSSRAPCCLETKDQTSSLTFSLHKGPYLIIAPPPRDTQTQSSLPSSNPGLKCPPCFSTYGNPMWSPRWWAACLVSISTILLS